MCLGVYLYSDRELPLVAWREEDPSFNVGALQPFEEAVHAVVPRPFVYSLGAHTSCGCGFVEADNLSRLDVMKSRGALAAFVEAALATSPLDLYVCWNGEVGSEPRLRLRRQINDLAASDEWLAEGTLTHVLIRSI